tara:strand:+ start:873 stop:1607 length:735 start_codon:yes stop_codon:yes gene_type:complete
MSFKVYYCPENFFEEITIKVEEPSIHSKYTYSDCPVWKHRQNRTFVAYSPCTFRMGFDEEVLWYKLDDEDMVEISVDDFDCGSDSQGNIADDYYDDNIYCVLSDVQEDNPVVQLKFPNVHFWTDFDNPYVWFEMLDHPETALNNNFIGIGGWWNLASHPRNTSLALKFQDGDGELYIEKGDPLYRIRFYSENMNDKFTLEKKEISEELLDTFDDRRDKLVNDRKFMNTILFDKDARAKCPFHNV